MVTCYTYLVTSVHSLRGLVAKITSITTSGEGVRSLAAAFLHQSIELRTSSQSVPMYFMW